MNTGYTKLKNKKNLYQQGFTLLEVIIAVTVFALFVTAYVTSEGFNLTDSMNMKEELVLQKLAQIKMNKILLDTPELSDNLTLKPETGNFDDEGYADYEWSVEYKKFLIPDFSKIQGEVGEDTDKQAGEQAIKSKMFEIIQKNVEEMMWQVKVTVQEKNKKFPFSLATFLRNSKGKIKIEI